LEKKPLTLTKAYSFAQRTCVLHLPETLDPKLLKASGRSWGHFGEMVYPQEITTATP